MNMRYVMRHIKVGIALVVLLFLLLGTLLLLSVEKQKQTIRQEASVTPSINHVFVIVMENHNWSSIKGNSSAPYINNTLLPMAAHAEQYYNPPGIHPSEPNYLWLEAGSNLGVTDDNDPGSNHQQTAIHLVPMLNNAGFSWKSYQEDISGTSCPLVSSGQYAPKHNPFVFFDDITNNNSSTSQNCISHIRPYTELANDLQNNTVANYNFITPNLCNDMHDCSIATGDTWLANNIPTILNSSAYKTGGAIFITWDEGESNGHDSDGPIGMIVLSPFAKTGYQNSIHYTHSSTLRTIEEIFGLSQFLRDAANATDLSDLFTVPLTGNAATANPTPTQLVPTITPTANPTIPAGSSQTANAIITLPLQLPGIGPNNNLSPSKKVRVVTLTATKLDTNAVTTKQVIAQFNGSVFQTSSVLFTGLPVGKYQFKAKVNGYLSTILQDRNKTTTFTINQNTTIVFPTMTLIPGDIAPINGTSYGDDSLDLLDYNMFLGCINSPQKTVFCANPSVADLDDDGRIDGVDYNLLIRGFAAAQMRSNAQ